MNEYFDLNLDEVENAIASLNNVMVLKDIENKLYKDKPMEYLYNRYNMFPTRRDYDFESYNGIYTSDLAVLFLDAIYEDNYEVIEIPMDEDREKLEEIYFDFRVDESNRLFTEREFDDLCQGYNILKLKSKAINDALRIADGNETILNEIIKLASRIEINAGDLADYTSINLADYQVELLLGSYSIWDLEASTMDLLNLELYCKEVAYGKDKNRNN